MVDLRVVKHGFKRFNGDTMVFLMIVLPIVEGTNTCMFFAVFYPYVLFVLFLSQQLFHGWFEGRG